MIKILLRITIPILITINQESGPKRILVSFSGNGTKVPSGTVVVGRITSSVGIPFTGDWFWTNSLRVKVCDDPPPPYPEYGLGTTVGSGGVPFSSI